MNDQQEISNYSMEELLELRTQLSGSVEESFNEFCGQLQNFESELKSFKGNVNDAIKSQGKGYSILEEIGQWLQQLYQGAVEKEKHVHGILQEAQKALNNP